MQHWQHFTPMTVAQILDRTFTLYRNNFLRFITIVALVYIPVALVSTTVMATLVVYFGEELEAFQQPGYQGDALPPDVLMQVAAISFATLIFMWLGQELSKAALAKGVSDSYLGKEATVGGAMKALLMRGTFVLIAFIVVGIVFAFGSVFCLVPGIIFGVWFSLTTQIIVVENLGPFAAMSRSKQLLSGNMLRAFGLLALLWILAFIVVVVAFGQLGQQIGSAALPDHRVEQVIVAHLSQAIGQILVMPVVSIAMILFYYDLRIRKEGFDLQILAQTLSTQGTPADDQPSAQL